MLFFLFSDVFDRTGKAHRFSPELLVLSTVVSFSMWERKLEERWSFLSLELQDLRKLDCCHSLLMLDQGRQVVDIMHISQLARKEYIFLLNLISDSMNCSKDQLI